MESEALVTSIRQRLQNVATVTGEAYQLVMERYVVERFLFRLGKSEYSESFIVKGATLFWVWQGQVHRPTRDLDMLRIGNADEATLKSAVSSVCSIKTEDGLVFDLETLVVGPIREQSEYGGTRTSMTVRLGSARLKFQIDIGVGDAITPAITTQKFPSLLQMEAPTIKCYPVETVLAEKLDAIVSRGADNSRMKDFFDLKFILDSFELSGAVVLHAIKRTFERRGTAIPVETPYALTVPFYEGERQNRQWAAFVSKGRLHEDSKLSAICLEIGGFAAPIFAAIVQQQDFPFSWVAGDWKAP